MIQLYQTKQGNALIEQSGEHFRLSLPPCDATAYHNSQISTYINRSEFIHNPPVYVSLRAYAEGKIHGTAGFGFWNHPYDPTMSGIAGLRLPKAIWFFFSSPPNNMPLAMGVPGSGFKCATFNAANWRFVSLLPAAPLGFLLMRIPRLYRLLWPFGQAAIGVSEHILNAQLLQTPHDYTIGWKDNRIKFEIDGEIIHETTRTPSGPLGFIAWVDNQYAIVTPKGNFGSGYVDVPKQQSLVIENLNFTVPEPSH